MTTLLAFLVLVTSQSTYAESDWVIEDVISLPLGGANRKAAQEKYGAQDPDEEPDQTLLKAQPPTPIPPESIDPDLAYNRRRPENALPGWNFRLNYFLGAQRAFVFPPSEIAFPDEENYLTGKAPGSAAAATRFAEYGAEFALRHDFQSPLFLTGRLSLHPFSLRPMTTEAVAHGWNMGMDFYLGLRVPVNGLGMFRFSTGSRTHFSLVDRLPFANTFVQFWLFQGSLEFWRFEVLVEGGLSDMGSSTLSNFGVLRSAITQRFRVAYKQPLGNHIKLVAGLELQQMSRSYFGSTRLASMSAFNVNERSYLGMIGLEY